jgi:hypothetical protein
MIASKIRNGDRIITSKIPIINRMTKIRPRMRTIKPKTRARINPIIPKTNPRIAPIIPRMNLTIPIPSSFFDEVQGNITRLVEPLTNLIS